jgi:hypothetical protein
MKKPRGSRGTEPESRGRGYDEAPMAENPVVYLYQFKVVLRGVSPRIWRRAVSSKSENGCTVELM